MTVSGLLIIDKPCGLTSHDVVAKVRKKLGTRRVGHAGTLDPDASGVLVLCVGESTRLLEYLTAERKTYTGEIVFGVGTDTDDATGVVIAEKSAQELTESKLSAVETEFVGEITQQVPRYSAVHIEGQRAYDLARAGIEFELPTRQVHIYSLCFADFRQEGLTARAKFETACSKGTYIRSLCRDIGKFLGLPAHMSSLRRIASGAISIDWAVSLAEFESASDASVFLQNPWVALKHFPSLELNSFQIERLAEGQMIKPPSEASDGIYMVMFDNQIVMVVECFTQDGRRLLRPRKVFWKRGQSHASHRSESSTAGK